MRLLQDFLSKHHTFKVNWALILAFVVFWSYVVTGSVFVSDTRKGDIFILCLTFLLFVILLLLGLKKSNFFQDAFRVTNVDLVIFFWIFSALLCLFYKELTNPIIVDEVYHSQYALRLPMSLTEIFSMQYLYLKNAMYIKVLWLICFVILFLSSLFLIIIRKLNIIIKTILLSFIFLILGLFILNIYGHNYDPHPPLRLFPLYLSSTILYPSDLSFRLPQFIGYSFFVYMSYRFSKLYFQNHVALLFSFIIATIPIFGNVGILVEQSIWSAIFFGYITILIIQKTLNVEYNIQYLRLFSLLSISILLRQSSIVGIIPIGLLYLIDRWRLKDFSLLNLKTGSLVIAGLVCVPFFLKSIVFGTPSTSSGSNSSIITNLINAFNSGVIFNSLLNNYLYYIIFLPFLFVAFRKSRLYSIVIIIFLVANLLIFYNTNSIVWGANRYQIEIFMPIMFSGIFWFFYYYRSNKLVINLLAILLIVNLLLIKNLTLFNKPVDERKLSCFDDCKKLGETIVLSEFVVPIDKALTQLPKEYRKSLYIHGHTYGVFHQILHGQFSVDEVIQNRTNIDLLNVGWGDSREKAAKKINQNPNINYVLISTLEHESLRYHLLQYEWIEHQAVYDNYYGGTVFRLQRSPFSNIFKPNAQLPLRLHNIVKNTTNLLQHLNIESINDKASQNNIFAINDSTLNLKGWIFSNDFHTFDDIIIELADTKNNKYYIDNTYFHERGDVANAFNNKDLILSGFSVHANLSHMPKGKYTISVIANQKSPSWLKYTTNQQIDHK